MLPELAKSEFKGAASAQRGVAKGGAMLLGGRCRSTAAQDESFCLHGYLVPWDMLQEAKERQLCYA